MKKAGRTSALPSAQMNRCGIPPSTVALVSFASQVISLEEISAVCLHPIRSISTLWKTCVSCEEE